MNVVILEAAALIMTALLGGMETVCGARAFRGNHETPGRIWRSRLFHRSTAVWLFLLVGAWYAAAAAVYRRRRPGPGSAKRRAFAACFRRLVLGARLKSGCGGQNVVYCSAWNDRNKARPGGRGKGGAICRQRNKQPWNSFCGWNRRMDL